MRSWNGSKSSKLNWRTWRARSAKLSNDPAFVEKVRDITGLYLHPPGKALVLCVDEKSEIQALERTQTLLAMGSGYVQGLTRDHVRQGTTTLSAALDVANGHLISRVRPYRRLQEVMGGALAGAGPATRHQATGLHRRGDSIGPCGEIKLPT